MSNKLREKMQKDLLAIAKSSNVSPQEFISDLGSTFLNICGLICCALGFTTEERDEFFDMLIDSLSYSIHEAKLKREKNGTI